YGAGVEGQQLSWSMLTDPDARYLPVAFLDDDPQRRGLRVSGVGGHGTSADLADVAARAGADLLAITGRSTDGAAIGELSRAAAAGGAAAGAAGAAEADAGWVGPERRPRTGGPPGCGAREPGGAVRGRRAVAGRGGGLPAVLRRRRRGAAGDQRRGHLPGQAGR